MKITDRYPAGTKSQTLTKYGVPCETIWIYSQLRINWEPEASNSKNQKYGIWEALLKEMFSPKKEPKMFVVEKG